MNKIKVKAVSYMDDPLDKCFKQGGRLAWLVEEQSNRGQDIRSGDKDILYLEVWLRGELMSAYAVTDGDSSEDIYLELGNVPSREIEEEIIKEVYDKTMYRVNLV